MEEPVDSAPTAARLRDEVRRFVTECGTRRALPTLVHVGMLAGRRITFPIDASYDAGLRADLVTRALDRFDDPGPLAAWLTRGGLPSVHDDDLAWLVAADTGFGRHGVPQVPFFAVTRHGWLDVRTGQALTWRRVRPLPAALPQPQ
ncbi:MAG: hypothetical protein ACR2FG_06340 [Marmoricola sp.]